MKKRLRILAFVGLAVASLLLMLFLCGFGRNWLSVRQIEKIQLTASGGTTVVELKPEDVCKFVTYYNLSRYVGTVTAENCEMTFLVRIHLNDGSWISLLDYEGARMNVTTSESERFWVDNVLLLHTIQNLAEDYGVTLEAWGCC
jgi:hypothetical protein